jgi:hypothetical protein
MAKKHIITSLALCALVGCAADPGTTLYLNRGTETTRAVFVYANDCELVARIMDEAEPADWYCK